MPAIRGKQKKAPKSTKAKSYTKASAAAKSKSPSDASKPSPTENGTYDRIQMFTDVIRGSKPDWPTLATEVNKTVNQCKDIWRKVLLPALLDGRERSAGGNGAWDRESKIKVLAAVLKVSYVQFEELTTKGIEPDWGQVAAAQGRTVTQVKDVWRKVLLPRLLKGAAIV